MSGRDEAHGDDDLTRDVQNLVSLGLRLSDIQKLWRGLRHVEPSAVHAAGERLMAAKEVPIARQASLGLELVVRCAAESPC